MHWFVNTFSGGVANVTFLIGVFHNCYNDVCQLPVILLAALT